MVNGTPRWFWYGRVLFFFFGGEGGAAFWKFLFMPSEDGIIGLDLRQIEHPDAGPSMSSCSNENIMQKLSIMVTRAL